VGSFVWIGWFMKLFQFTVARKLWALVIGLLAGMLLLVAGSLAYSKRVNEAFLRRWWRRRLLLRRPRSGAS
jgi:hypothetical protein